jgi:hypothetical protein
MGIFSPVIRIYHSLWVALMGVVSAWAGAGKVEINQRHMAAAPYIIDQPGQYILTSALHVSDTNSIAIVVETSDVDLDLNGFTITGPGGSSSLSAIFQSSIYDRLRVHNGNITGWTGSGAYAVHALGLANTLEQLHVAFNAQGLLAGAQSVVQDCVVYSNASVSVEVVGIDVGTGSVVRRCLVQGLGTFSGNTYGIRGAFNVTVEDCVTYQINSPDNAYGIFVNHGGVVRNGAMRWVTGGNEAYGIYAGNAASLSGSAGGKVTGGVFASAIRGGDQVSIQFCAGVESGNGLELFNDGEILSSIASTNSQWGLLAASRSRIADSYAVRNGLAGIYFDGARGQAFNNDAAYNTIGYDFNGATDWAGGNSALANSGPHFNAPAGTRLGQTVTNPGLFFIETNSWANFILTD